MRMEAMALALALAGGPCDSSSAAPGDAGVVDDSAVVGCQNDPRADAYADNLQKPGKAGQLKFVLVSADPAPPALETNTWTLRVTDAGGSPAQNVTFKSITPFMPDHGHGTQIVPTATANPDGTFTIAPLYLFMPGLWQITIDVQSGTTTDSAVYSFCVAG